MMMKKTQRSQNKRFYVVIGMMALLGVLLVSPLTRAVAAEGDLAADSVGSDINSDYDCSLSMAASSRFKDYKNKWVDAFKQMTEQLSLFMFYQTAMVGTLFDGKQQMEAQLLMQQLKAEAHRDYQPSVQICRIGTNVRSLAASEALAAENSYIVSKMLMDREMLTNDSSASGGITMDKPTRLAQFKEIYCDPEDGYGALVDICPAKTTTAARDRLNKDVNFRKTLSNPLTLDAQFNDSTLTNDEIDVLALGKNLFAHDLLEVIAPQYIEQEAAMDDIMDMRSIQAMRSVIWNSYGHQVGMKTQGSGAAADYVKKLLEEMGADANETDIILTSNPSYYAQMEFLTKKFYQGPEFFTNLYDKPANVQRMRAALKAIQLMQDRDRFEASLRREMLISLLLEDQLRDEQKRVTNDYYREVSRGVKEE